MSAGLVPVVPNIGGQSEFVHSKYQFHTLEDAAHIISSAFDVSSSERHAISYSAARFSTSHYIKRFERLVNELFVSKQII
jgi:hypothetical protein